MLITVEVSDSRIEMVPRLRDGSSETKEGLCYGSRRSGA